MIHILYLMNFNHNNIYDNEDNIFELIYIVFIIIHYYQIDKLLILKNISKNKYFQNYNNANYKPQTI